nr:GYDIA family GHMP kinase [Allomuricauda sp.]
MPQEFYSNGKLLLSGEYAILDGAVGLAVPTKFGQSLKVELQNTAYLDWKSLDETGNVWFQAQFEVPQLQLTSTTDEEIGERLLQILKSAQSMNPDFLATNSGGEVKTLLTFSRNWGLGTSSTLINNVANWAGIDAYSLLQKTFGGSGYDIACAQKNGPITYSVKSGVPTITDVDFDPPYKDQLFFVFLNQKKNSREAIANYRSIEKDKTALIEELSRITQAILDSKELDAFESLINAHEKMLSDTLGIPTIKSHWFADYPGAIKSLGAWGGDFILATGSKQDQEYFRNKGFATVLSYSEMVL